MITLNLRGLSVRLGNRAVLSNIDADFQGGQIVSLVGQNGCGKTTLLKAVAGICSHDGDVLIQEDGKIVSRKAVRYMPQLSTVTSRLTVFEMVLLGLEGQLGWRVGKETFDRVDRMLHLLEIDRFAHAPVASLSGGQKQLVFLAQVFVSSPKVLLLDEPTSALDLRYQLVVMNAIERYTKATGAVTIVVMHDLVTASRFSQKVLMLNEGNVLAYDAPENVFSSDRLESVYGVKVLIEPSRLGAIHVVPVEPIPQPHEHHH